MLATPRYFARPGWPTVPADLAAHEAVLFTQRSRAWSFRRESTEMSVMVQGCLWLSAAEGVRAAVLADMGLTIASDWMFAPELASGEVNGC